MLSKIVTIVLNWLVTTIVLPVTYYLYDYLRLRKIEKESKKAAKELNNAKTQSDIDSAVDRMP